jgi:hypothetical protein
MPKNISKPKTQRKWGLPNDYFFNKVVNWALELSNMPSRKSHLEWSDEEKAALRSMLKSNSSQELTSLIKKKGYKEFLTSIIDNGLNGDDIKLFFLYQDKLSLNNFKLAFSGPDFIFSNDFITSKDKIPAGFYMIELKVDDPDTNFQINKLTFHELPLDQACSESICIEAYPNRICKRLIWLKNPSKLMIRNEGGSLKKLSKLRIAKVTEKFFTDRIFRKLRLDNKLNLDPKYQLDQIYSRYNSVFSRQLSQADEYSKYISEVENKIFYSNQSEKRIAKKLGF